MKIRKIISGLLMCTLLAAGTVQLPASINVSAAADGGFTEEQIAASKVKPTLSVSRIDLSASQGAGSVQTVQISVKNANASYSSTGFHVYFDSRLTLIANQWGGAATKGAAVSQLSSESYSRDNCIFLSTAGKQGLGRDGVMWTFDVKLPDNAADGDFYPIRIVYEKGKVTEDVFTNNGSDNDNLLMQAWTFTKGIENGYIQIGEYAPGDANCNGTVDLSDAVLIMQCVSNPTKFSINSTVSGHITKQGEKNADVCSIGDGITSKDALSIQKYMLKLIPSLPEN